MGGLLLLLLILPPAPLNLWCVILCVRLLEGVWACASCCPETELQMPSQPWCRFLGFPRRYIELVLI